jgi:hypothetical protein
LAIRTTQAAKQAIQDDAAARARAYLEREAPNTVDAIAHLLNVDKWSVDEIMAVFEDTYGLTEEKTRHKIRLLVQAMYEDDRFDNP